MGPATVLTRGRSRAPRSTRRHRVARQARPRAAHQRRYRAALSASRRFRAAVLATHSTRSEETTPLPGPVILDNLNGKVGSAAGAGGCCDGRARAAGRSIGAVVFGRAGAACRRRAVVARREARPLESGGAGRRGYGGGARPATACGPWRGRRPSYRAAGAVGGRHEGGAPASVGFRAGIRGRGGAVMVAGVSARMQ